MEKDYYNTQPPCCMMVFLAVGVPASTAFASIVSLVELTLESVAFLDCLVWPSHFMQEFNK